MIRTLLCILSCIAAVCFFGCGKEAAGASEGPVLPSDLPGISFPEERVVLKRGASLRLEVTVDGAWPEGGRLVWSSSDFEYVEVTPEGVIRGLKPTRGDYTSREVQVTASLYVDNLFAAECSVRVVVEELYRYRYRLILNDKGPSPGAPEEYLSQRAVERRWRQHIALDDTDRPVSEEYLRRLTALGGRVVATSKWLGTVCVEIDDRGLMEQYMALPFVADSVLVWRQVLGEAEGAAKRANPLRAVPAGAENLYGAAGDNIAIHNGAPLHERGFRGQGMVIAVIDGGFPGVATNPFFASTHIAGYKSFIPEYPDASYENEAHGLRTLSCMAVDRPGSYVGTAPEAVYWLLGVEKEDDESPVEEDYLVAALEYADSVGADVANVSLYYKSYGSLYWQSYTYEDMDGRTAFATRGANIAAAKGMLVVCCAGNDGEWIGSPGDSPDVLTVGNVYRTGDISGDSSRAMTVDGRMKPDLVALGMRVAVVSRDGEITTASGTSYSAPLVSGLAACLWQAYPELTNRQLLDILRRSGDRSDAPLLPYGNGIPDFERAARFAETLSGR